MTLNTLNLYLHQGKYFWTEGGLAKVNQDHLPREKPEWQTKGLADAILEVQPDFIMLQEVEGQESLDRFIRRYLNNAYKAYMPPTNDGRQIGNAFLVRHGMGIKVKRESFTDLTWKNMTGRKEKIFTRNFPLFKIYIENHDSPKMIVAGVHYKSKRDRVKDPRSFYKRQKEAEESVRILEEVQLEHPSTPIVIMGDFNSSRDKEELDSFKRLDLVDLSDKPERFIDEHNLGDSTFVFFPGDRDEVVRESLDGAFLSSDLDSFIQSYFVYRYKDEDGQVKPLPSTLAERHENPSDHYPVVFDLDPKVLYPHHNKDN